MTNFSLRIAVTWLAGRAQETACINCT